MQQNELIRLFGISNSKGMQVNLITVH